MRPLADEIRPQTLDDVAGQKHLLGEGALLRRLIENGTDTVWTDYGLGCRVTADKYDILRSSRHRKDHRGQHYRQAGEKGAVYP